ncbi:MAG: glycosyltransferase family 2 protein [Patescibacteria group bacterium]
MIFSVIIPTYNRKKEIKECLQSLYDQDFPRKDYEIIVVDDGSLDGSYKELLHQNICLLRLKKNEGPSKARNFGALRASGKYLAFTDSDCVLPRDWLKLMYEAFNKYKDLSCVGGNIINIDNSIFGNYETYLYKSYIKKNASYISKERDEAPFALGNICYLKKDFVDVGGFLDRYPAHCSGEDSYLKEKFLKRQKKVLYIPVDVLHNHKYSLSGFTNQSLERGGGMLLDSKRKGKFQRKSLIVLRLILTPLYICYSLVKFNRNLYLVFCDSMFYFFRNIGKLKYYNLVKEFKF